MLVLEDLHWADQSTLDLLALRTQTRRVAGCVVVATYRSDELAAGDPLRLLLAELERSGRIERVELRPFARGELIAQMTGILGARPARDVVEDVLARSDGNPFFAEELLAAGSGRHRCRQHAPGRSARADRDAVRSPPRRSSDPLRRPAVTRASGAGGRLRHGRT